MLKLFAFDLDQTLLVENRIRGDNRIMLKELAAAGKVLCLVSGRVLPSLDYLAQEAGLDVISIANNGAVVRQAGKILEERAIRPDLAERLVDFGQAFGGYFHFYSRDQLYSPFLNQKKLHHLLKEPIQGERIPQCGINIWPMEDIRARARAGGVLKIQYTLTDSPLVNEKLLASICSLSRLTITKSGRSLLEVMAAGVDKWEALERVAKRLGIAREEICAMGDQLNDLAMLKNAGVGVAMGNAVKEVQAQADLVTAPFDQEGVAKALRALRDQGAW